MFCCLWVHGGSWLAPGGLRDPCSAVQEVHGGSWVAPSGSYAAASQGDLRRVKQMVDPRGLWPPGFAERLGDLALLCTCEQEMRRPSMAVVATGRRPGPLRAI